MSGSGITQRDIASILAWANAFLRRRKLHARDIHADFTDGVLLIILLQEAYGEQVAESYNKVPKQPFHKLDNLSQAFRFLQEQDVRLVSIDPQSIVDGQIKQTLNLLWNILRHLTVRGLENLGPQFKGKKSVSMRKMLITWANEALAAEEKEIAKLSELFTEPQQFVTVLNRMLPQPSRVVVDVKLEPVDVLDKALHAAETLFGIPRVMDASDLYAAHCDESGLENYLCMLISAQHSHHLLHKKNEEEAKMGEMMRVKEEEVEKLRIKMEKEQKQTESIQNELNSLKDLFKKEKEHRECIGKNESESDSVKVSPRKLTNLSKTFSKSQKKLFTSYRDQISKAKEYGSVFAEQGTKIKTLEATVVDLNAELYTLHREYEALLQRVEFDVHVKEHVEPEKDRLEDMVKRALVEKQSVDEFIDVRSDLGSVFMVDVEGKSLLPWKNGPQNKKMWVELRGSKIQWRQHQMNSPVLGSISLDDYQVIEYEHVQEVVFSAFFQKKRKESYAMEAVELEEIPPIILRPRNSTATVLVLYAIKTENQPNTAVNISTWVHELNDRILLLSYLRDMQREAAVSGRLQGSRQIAHFIADPQASILKLQNHILHHLVDSLDHFHRVLVRRPSLSLQLDNMGLDNSHIDPISAILTANTSFKALHLPNNLLTSTSLAIMESSLMRSYSLETLVLDGNNIDDEGACILAACFADKPNLTRLSLQHNSIGDDGVCALLESIRPTQFPALELGHNCISDRGCEACLTFCSNTPSITSIHLDYNKVSDAGLKSLVVCITREGSQIDTMNVGGNPLTSASLSVLADIATINRPVHVDVSQCSQMNLDGYEQLLQKVGRHPIHVSRFAFQTSGSP